MLLIGAKALIPVSADKKMTTEAKLVFDADHCFAYIRKSGNTTTIVSNGGHKIDVAENIDILLERVMSEALRQEVDEDEDELDEEIPAEH